MDKRLSFWVSWDEVVSSPKKNPIAKDFTGGDLGKVPGEENVLVGEIIQVFEKYGENDAYKDGRVVWLLKHCIAAL